MRTLRHVVVASLVWTLVWVAVSATRTRPGGTRGAATPATDAEASRASADLAFDRSRLAYDRLIVDAGGHELSPPDLAAVEEFVWRHWVDRTPGYAVVTMRAPDGGRTYHLFVEPGPQQRWWVARVKEVRRAQRGGETHAIALAPARNLVWSGLEPGISSGDQLAADATSPAPRLRVDLDPGLWVPLLSDSDPSAGYP